MKNLISAVYRYLKMILKKAKANLEIAVRPAYWCVNGPIDEAWSLALNRAMDEHKFEATHVGSNWIYADVYIGAYKVWTNNHPYASFSQIRDDGWRMSGDPDRKTRLRAVRKLRAELSQEHVALFNEAVFADNPGRPFMQKA